MRRLPILVLAASALALTLAVYSYCAPIFREVMRALATH